MIRSCIKLGIISIDSDDSEDDDVRSIDGFAVEANIFREGGLTTAK